MVSNSYLIVQKKEIILGGGKRYVKRSGQQGLCTAGPDTKEKFGCFIFGK